MIKKPNNTMRADTFLVSKESEEILSGVFYLSPIEGKKNKNIIQFIKKLLIFCAASFRKQKNIILKEYFFPKMRKKKIVLSFKAEERHTAILGNISHKKKEKMRW